MSDIFLVVDEKNTVAGIKVTILEREVTLCAIFHDEQDALEFLWAAQDQFTTPHTVRKVSSLMYGDI